MKTPRKIHIPLIMLVLVAVITISTYVIFPSIFGANEVQTSTTLTVPGDTPQIEAQQKLKENMELNKQQKLEEQATAKNQQILEEQQKLGNQLKAKKQQILNKQQKLENRQKLEAQQKSEEESKVKAQEELAIKQKFSSKMETSSSKSTQVATLLAKPKSKLLIDKIKGKGTAKQAIIVTTNGFGKVNATITTFEIVNGTWRQVASFAGNVGKSGFTYNKVEGDGHSPIGVYSLGTTFGRYSNPGTSMNYRRSTNNDFWVDDVKSPLYNTWQKGPVLGRWTSAEKMYIPQYNYGFVINHNTTKRIPGKGSAIFFHVWSGSGHGTAGCTTVAQTNVINTLKWLKPSKDPLIIEGPMSEVSKL